MAEWPTQGSRPWGTNLKAYIDESDRLTVLANGATVNLDDTKPDGYLVGYEIPAGATATIEGTLYGEGVYTFRRNAATYGGWRVHLIDEGSQVVPSPDGVAPVAGTLASSAITETGATVTVSGASDAVALHASPYSFSKDNGSNWTNYQSSNVYAWTGLTPATGHQMRHRVRDAAGNVTTGTAITVTTVTPAGWAVYDTLTSALIGADGARGTPADFTTSGGRTWRHTGTGGVSVNAGRITATTPGNQNNEGQFLSGAPTGEVALEFDYADVSWSGDYGSTVQVTYPQQTPSAWVRLRVSSPGANGGTRVLDMTSDYSAAQIVFTSPAGHGYSWNNGGTLTGLPNSARLRVERRGQVLHAYVNDVLVLSGDYSACTFSGNPNPLLAVAPTFRLINHAKVTNFEWERYV